MSSDNYAEGRTKGLREIEAIVKTERGTADKADLSYFTGNKKVLNKPETQSFFKSGLNSYFDIIQKDLTALLDGSDTGDIREIPPYEADDGDRSAEAGRISAYRDMYNVVREVGVSEAVSPVPSTITKLQKKKVALAQHNILEFARNELVKHIATKGQEITQKYQQDKYDAVAEKQQATAAQNNRQNYDSPIQRDFKAQSGPSVPEKNFAGIDLDYVTSFDDKNLLHPADMDKDEKAYMEGLQEIVTVIENYKSVIKKKTFLILRAFPCPRAMPAMPKRQK